MRDKPMAPGGGINSDQTSSAAPTPRVTFNQVTKRFPGIIANDRIDLALWPGEVHVLLGENGAGKSTLVSLLSGLQQPDAGTIAIDGRVCVLSSPRRALELGIGTVFQHAMMVPGLSVVDNIALGDRWWRRPDRRRYAKEVNALAADIGVRVDPFALAGSLSLGEQQQAEIVRTLLRGGRVLILDEATAMLTPHNAEELGQLMRRLVAQGLAVVFITHKLNEALAWGDRITVLRLGRKVGELDPSQLRALDTEQATRAVVRMMFNLQDAAITAPPSPSPRRDAPGALPILELRGVAAKDPQVPLKGIDLTVGAGEILGIAGIDGNGQKQLAEVLAGQRPLSSGRIVLGGADIGQRSIGQRRRLGLRYVTDDRLGEGIVGSFPVSLNLLLKQLGEAPFWRRGIEQPAVIAEHARRRIDQYDIRTPTMDTPTGKLSGGNIQKTLLARELEGEARLVIFAKPTHGLDIQNMRAIRQRIRHSAEQGMAVMLISTDLEELLSLSHRIAVMSRGRILDIVDNTPLARGRIGELMSGVEP